MTVRAWAFNAVHTASTRPVCKSSNCATSVVVPRSTAMPNPSCGVKARTESSARMAASHCARSRRSSPVARATGEPPAVGQFRGRQADVFLSRDGQIAGEQPHFATFAAAAAAAGKFHAGRKQRILKRQTAGDGKGPPQGQEFDLNGVTHLFRAQRIASRRQKRDCSDSSSFVVAALNEECASVARRALQSQQLCSGGYFANRKNWLLSAGVITA